MSWDSANALWFKLHDSQVVEFEQQHLHFFSIGALDKTQTSLCYKTTINHALLWLHIYQAPLSNNDQASVDEAKQLGMKDLLMVGTL